MSRPTLGIRPPAVLALTLATSIAPAPAGAQAAGPACDSHPDLALLDFWVGAWTVHVGAQRVGTNRIVKVLDGCAIEERWTDAGGGRGQSLFYYVAAEDEWRQVWVTERALSVGGVKEKRLVERLPGGGVRFQGTIAGADGASHLDRTTLTPLPGGRVRQHIEISTDGGRRWRTTFDAEYRPSG